MTPDSSIPVPPIFHLEAQEARLNPATAEIEQLLTFHGKVRMAIAYTPDQARLAAQQLKAACNPPEN